MNQENIPENRSKRFLKAIGLYAIGNLGSKLITFLMVPLYTYFVLPNDMGFYDVSLTLIIALIPIITLQMRDGAYRFLIDEFDETNRKRIISFVCKELLISTIIVCFIWCALHFIYPIQYLSEICLLLLIMFYCEVLLQVARAVGGTSCYAIAGIISSFGIGLFSIIFVAWLGYGLRGIFWANILARFVALCYVEYKIKLIRKYFSFSVVVGSRNKEILRYVFPLLPSALCWSLLDCSGRLFVQNYLGLEINGLFAVAFRFASIIYTFAIIYIQAWQEMALVNYETKDRDEFFSEMYNSFLYFISFIVVVVCYMLKFNYGWLVDNSYNESLKLVYPMSAAVAISTVSQFLDLGYQCSKETKRSVPSILCALIVNVIVSFVLIEILGVWAVVLASLLAFVFLYVYRSIDVRRYFKLKINKSSLVAIMIALLSAIPFYVFNDIANIIYFGIIVVAYVMLMPQALKAKLKLKK